MKKEKFKETKLEKQSFLEVNNERKVTRARKSRRNKEEQGITLIILVITIIILLILTGVTLNATLVGNVSIQRANQASETYRKVAEKENNKIEKLIDEMGKNKRRKWGNQTSSRSSGNSRTIADTNPRANARNSKRFE